MVALEYMVKFLVWEGYSSLFVSPDLIQCKDDKDVRVLQKIFSSVESA